MKDNCLGGICIKCVKKTLSDLLIIPFKNGTTDVHKLFSYFLYSAPNIESTHSRRIPQNMHADIFDRMMKDCHYQYQKFCQFNASIEKEFSTGYIDGNDICLKCKRYICKKKKPLGGTPSETDLECFLRHIRNSIAHGRVYLCHAGNRIHIVFEDENTTKNLSARIVCIKADLEHWKSVLSDQRNYQT